jgi:hypothetical protein
MAVFDQGARGQPSSFRPILPRLCHAAHMSAIAGSFALLFALVFGVL